MPVKAIRKKAVERARKIWLPLAASLLLGGCSMLQQLLQPDQGATPAPTAPANEDVPVVAPVTKPVAKPKPPVAARPPVVVKKSIEPQSLVGLGEEEMNRLLGQPRDVRNDPPAMVWNYAAGTCKLDLFFYLDLKSQDFRALAYSFDPNTNSDSAKNVCLEKIQEVNRERGN